MKNKEHSIIEMPTPKESNVYSKVICRPVCDSFGVEPGYECSIFYKHAIPAGLAWQRSCKFIALHSQKDEGLFSQVPLVAGGNYHLIPPLIPLSLKAVNKGIRARSDGLVQATKGTVEKKGCGIFKLFPQKRESCSHFHFCGNEKSINRSEKGVRNEIELYTCVYLDR